MMGVEEHIIQFVEKLRVDYGDEVPVITMTIGKSTSRALKDQLYQECKYVKRTSFDQANWINLQGIGISFTDL